jgi:hypothetical protein
LGLPGSQATEKAVAAREILFFAELHGAAANQPFLRTKQNQCVLEIRSQGNWWPFLECMAQI